MVYFFAGMVVAYPALSFITFRKATKKTIFFPKDEQHTGIHFKEGVYIIKSDKGFFALSGRCTHLGCSLGYDQFSQRFVCPCHGSVFDKNGTRIGGPAKKDMKTLPVTTGENGEKSVVIAL